MKSTNILVLLFVCCACVGFCDVTDIEKQRQLDRYFQAVPVEETLNGNIELIAVSMSPEDKKRVVEVMTRYFDIALFKKSLGDAMLNHLTAREIKALADFYSSIDGKSAQKKLASTVGELLPILLSEFERANALYDKDLKTISVLAPHSSPLPADELILVERAIRGDVEAKKELRVLYSEVKLSVLERESKPQPIDPAVQDRIALANDYQAKAISRASSDRERNRHLQVAREVSPLAIEAASALVLLEKAYAEFINNEYWAAITGWPKSELIRQVATFEGRARRLAELCAQIEQTNGKIYISYGLKWGVDSEKRAKAGLELTKQVVAHAMQLIKTADLLNSDKIEAMSEKELTALIDTFNSQISQYENAKSVYFGHSDETKMNFDKKYNPK